MNRAEKEAEVEAIGAELKSAEAMFAIDYRGISVSQAAELRGKLREADASFKIVKNRLTKLAADKAGTQGLDEVLQGPTALTFVKGDTAQAAKAITTFNKEHDVLTYKGGLMGEELLDEQQFMAIAKLPSRDELNAQLAGIVASPIVTLTRGLGSMISGLAIQLQQVADKGLVSGEAPEKSEAPAEESSEAPAEEAAEESTEETAEASTEETTEAPAEDSPAAEEEATPNGEASAGESSEDEAPAEEADAEEAPAEEADAEGEAADGNEGESAE